MHGPAGSIAIASSMQSTQGTMNGAFGFRSRAGFDFLAVDETVVPAGTPALLPFHMSYNPPFENREMVAVPTAGPGGNRGHAPAWALGQSLVRLRTNVSATTIVQSLSNVSNTTHRHYLQTQIPTESDTVM